MSAPVKHTCPDIDKAIKTLKEIQKSASDGMKSVDKTSDQWYLFHDIEWEIDGLVGTLEGLRKSNDELRSWGENLDKDLDNAGNEIYKLEQQIEESKQSV